MTARCDNCHQFFEEEDLILLIKVERTGADYLLCLECFHERNEKRHHQLLENGSDDA